MLRIDSCWIMAPGFERLARSTISTTRQPLVLASGRVSMIRTVSPVLRRVLLVVRLHLLVRVTCFP